jgi:hypothetical protein
MMLPALLATLVPGRDVIRGERCAEDRRETTGDGMEHVPA